VIDLHEKLLHRGIEAVYYELKKEFYWPGIKTTISNVIRKCATCITNNRKKKGGTKFIETSRKFQKVALDLAEISSEGKYILVIIDYFTRYCKMVVIDNKRTSTICGIIRGLFENQEQVEDTDNGNTSKEFENLCHDLKARHIKVGVEAHASNGRVERVIATIKEALLKNKEGTIEGRIKVIEEKYNNTYHNAIKCTPREAVKDISGIARLENGPEGTYKKRFKQQKREKFRQGQQVKIAKLENLQGASKEYKGRFIENGVVIEECGNDTYLVKKVDGKIMKKRHSELKGVGII
jgi:rubrerythrin